MQGALVVYLRQWGVNPAPDDWCPHCALPSVVRIVCDLTRNRHAAPSTLYHIDVCTDCGVGRQEKPCA